MRKERFVYQTFNEDYTVEIKDGELVIHTYSLGDEIHIITLTGRECDNLISWIQSVRDKID